MPLATSIIASRRTVYHGLTRRYLSQVYTCGEGFLGCLGHGDFSDCEVPKHVEVLASTKVRKVSAGWTHSAAVSSDGQLLVWGRPYDFKGSLRLNNMNRLLPFLVAAVNAFSSTSEVLAQPVIVPLAPGAPRSNKPGNLTRPPPSNIKALRTSTVARRHTASSHQSVNSFSDSRVVDVACSAALTVALTQDGRVYCMGQNRWAQCGQGPKGPAHVFEPVPVGGELVKERVVSIAVGFQHVLVLCQSGLVYGWGKGERGQLGTNGGSEEVPTQGESSVTGRNIYHMCFAVAFAYSTTRQTPHAKLDRPYVGDAGNNRWAMYLDPPPNSSC